MRHEHDHFPVPERCGGKWTVPACLDCHDWKDRVPFADWPPEMKARVNTWEFVYAFFPPTREQKLFHAKMVALFMDEADEEKRLMPRGTWSNDLRRLFAATGIELASGALDPPQEEP